MQFKLNFKIPETDLRISHKDKIILLGSCFSDEMAAKLNYSGFNCLSNPFGTLYHPIALSNVIQNSIDSNIEVSILQRDKLFFSWDSASVVVGNSEDELKQVLIEKRNEFKKTIQDSSVLIFTFGTAFAYRNLGLDKIVGNCHKISATNFKKELSSVEEMLEIWQELFNRINREFPGKRIILTVSPVRHNKDGIIENNRSKARLIEFVNQLCENITNVEYFPSYEIVIDELRDYRFYNEDFTHPSSQAIEYVWQRFKHTYFREETINIIDELQSIRKMMSHRSIHKESELDKTRLIKADEKLKELLHRHPELKL